MLSPVALRAQQVPPLIGAMRVNTRSAEQFEDVFRRDMARLGWPETSYRIQILFADGDSSRLPTMAQELVKSGAQIVVAFSNLGVLAAQKATSTIPIVGMADDLAGSGLVASVARPGGNTTGVSIMGFELEPKRLEVLHEIVPSARRIGVFVDESQRGGEVIGHVQQSATKFGLQVFVAHAQKREEIEPAMAQLQAAKVEAVQFLASSFLHSQRAWFIERLRVLKLPAMYEWPEFVDEGGLVSYAPRLSLCYRHVAVLVSRVLHGTKPADLPIEQPVTFTLAVNTGTARAIGLTLPELMLLRADVVVD